MKTIKVIDLLNKIANGEEVPKKIKYNGTTYEKDNDGDIDFYIGENFDGTLFLEKLDDTNELNDEVEIIEENKDIEKLKIEQDGSTYYIKNEHGTKCYLTKHSYLIADKVNELIDEVKKLKGKYE